MSIVDRASRHLRLTSRALARDPGKAPPFLILYVNSICNLTCEHCLYWRNLNRRDDLTFDEFEKLSLELGELENLNLSGGEPFLRQEFAKICTLFIRNNGVKQIYVPTNGYFTEKTELQLRDVLRSQDLQLFVCELSLDGMPGYHDRFRGNSRSFEKAMQTYEMLARLQKEDPRLRIHAISTATHENLEEIRGLTQYLFDHCPAMDHHNLGIIRGDRKNPSLRGPALELYNDLYRHVAAVWSERERDRYGSSVEPMLQWAKKMTLETSSQFVPCTAGILSGVIYANGDVSLCETHSPIGNLRAGSFFEIWNSEKANSLRASIRARECFCTNEISLWPSIVFQPVQLARAAVGARVWKQPEKT